MLEEGKYVGKYVIQQAGRHPRITPEHFIVCLRHHTKSYPHRERHPRITPEHFIVFTAPTPRTRTSPLSFIVFHGATQSVTLQHETETLFLVLRTTENETFAIEFYCVLWRYTKCYLAARNQNLVPCVAHTSTSSTSKRYTICFIASHSVSRSRILVKRPQFCTTLSFQRGNTNGFLLSPTLMLRLTVSALQRMVISTTQHKLFPSASRSRVMGNALSFAPH
jgi:hypothetical protein